MPRYIGSCVDLDGDKIERMMAGARELNYQTVMKNVGPAVRKVFSDYPWGRDVGKNNWRNSSSDSHVLTMRNDWEVRYFKGMYDGKPVYIVQHYGIEHVFSKEG